MQAGQIIRDADGVRLVFTRDFAVAVERLWQVLTDPELTARWIGRWAGDPASGEVQLWMSAEEGTPAATVTIGVCEAPSVLAVTTSADGSDWPLRLALSAGDDTSSTLTFTHELTEPVDVTSIGPGWEFYLDRLAAVLNGDEVPDDFEKYYPVRASAYA
ncbi:SRPBCC domain-containing protein [Kineosporia babensis]|uniref:SRPBCC domain-containing protein n=1 Tax=Kineosporia babensis TaxID=499548 RepID=A0A9X1SSK1_9ACTN|nr:SRPBCC domain-containing protein [Kineosporia babensis]MCD5309700.1 SRPBCC domain-containing protein [Kineosporia babensis]